MGKVHIYSAKACPFAHRTRLVLHEKSIDFELTEIDLSNKPRGYGEISLYGKVPAIESPPFAIIPKLYCAKADVHTFDDGATKWDFSGRNAFYGPYEYSGR